MRFAHVASTSLALALTLSACGSSPQPEQPAPSMAATVDPDGGPEDVPTTAAAPVGGFGMYTFESPEGVKGTLTIPTKATDQNVREYESYRNLANAPETTYIQATVDNQSVDTNANMYQVVIVTEDGEQVTFEGAGDRVEEWMSTFRDGDDEDSRKYNVGVDLVNKDIDVLRPGAKGKRVLAVEGELPSVQRVFVYPSGGMTEVAAVKAS